MTTTTNFVWDSVSDCLLSELDGTNAVQAVYTNEPQQYGGVLSQRRGTTTSTLHADALGTTRALTSSTQTTTDSYLYDAWGNLINSSGSTVNPFRWVGRQGYYWDSSTGLAYVRARMYQPTVARWMSVDPIKFVDGLNLYLCARNRPNQTLDPSGLACCCVDIITQHRNFIVPKSWVSCGFGFYWGTITITECWLLNLPFTCEKAYGVVPRHGERPATWEEECIIYDECGDLYARPRKPPTGKPSSGTSCNYPINGKVCDSGLCWEKQCVCQCAGDSPGMNCVRGCLQCATDAGAPVTIWTELKCKNKCKCNLTPNELARLDCCLNKDFNHGGCAGTFYVKAPMDPNPANTTCSAMIVP